MPEEIIDIFCHILPASYLEAARRMDGVNAFMFNRAAAFGIMADLDGRLKMADEFPGYWQVVTLASPPPETIAEPDVAAELARIANDAMTAIVAQHPNLFAGYVATLSLNNIDAALIEAERALSLPGARGIQLFTNVNGVPISDAHFMPLFELMAQKDMPVWIHPIRPMTVPDYPTEEVSKHELWWAIGWIYETTAMMLRLAFAGVFERWPDLKLITHHVGGFTPMLEARLASGMGKALYGSRTPDARKEIIETPLKEPLAEAVRRFYGDTASFGSAAAIECGLKFFGPERLLFGTDSPFDPEGGPGYIHATLRARDELDLAPEIRKQILSGNAQRLMNI